MWELGSLSYFGVAVLVYIIDIFMMKFGGQLDLFVQCPARPSWMSPAEFLVAEEEFMRRPVHKGKSAGRFRGEAGKTRAINIAPPPRRGGYRL